MLTLDLLKPEWREKAKDQHSTFGHCYVASEALYHFCGAEKSGLSPRWGKDENGTHWWLYSASEDRIIDPTKQQYYSVGKLPPYHDSHNASFLTKKPSKRAVEVMKRVGDLY